MADIIVERVIERLKDKEKDIPNVRLSGVLTMRETVHRHARCHAALLNTKTAAINVIVFMFTTT